jgi:hypothetical protein
MAKKSLFFARLKPVYQYGPVFTPLRTGYFSRIGCDRTLNRTGPRGGLEPPTKWLTAIPKGAEKNLRFNKL